MPCLMDSSGILHLVKTFLGHLCHPYLERFCLWRRDRLDETEQLVGSGYVGETHLAVCGSKFSTRDNLSPVSFPSLPF